MPREGSDEPRTDETAEVSGAGVASGVICVCVTLISVPLLVAFAPALILSAGFAGAGIDADGTTAWGVSALVVGSMTYLVGFALAVFDVHRGAKGLLSGCFLPAANALGALVLALAILVLLSLSARP